LVTPLFWLLPPLLYRGQTADANPEQAYILAAQSVLPPGVVIKGKPMPGHMGQASRTVQNLEIVQVHADNNLLLVKGAVPGANGDYVVIREAKKKPKKPSKGSGGFKE
jgi:large subunit ribosomal protein L3